MELRYKAIQDVPLKEHGRLQDILNDDTLCQAEKDVALLAILCDVDEKEIWKMTVPEVQMLMMNASKQMYISGNEPLPDTIKIGEWECEVMNDAGSIQYNQFVDFQTYWADLNKYKAEMLSTFLIPKGKKYNEDYDIHQLINDINDNISIHQFNLLLRSFLNGLEASIHNTQTSLLLTLMMKRMMTRNKKEREAYKEMVHQIRHLQSSLG